MTPAEAPAACGPVRPERIALLNPQTESRDHG